MKLAHSRRYHTSAKFRRREAVMALSSFLNCSVSVDSWKTITSAYAIRLSVTPCSEAVDNRKSHTSGTPRRSGADRSPRPNDSWSGHDTPYVLANATLPSACTASTFTDALPRVNRS